MIGAAARLVAALMVLSVEVLSQSRPGVPSGRAVLPTRTVRQGVTFLEHGSDAAWSATAIRADGAIIGRLRGSGTGRPISFADDRVVIREEDMDGIVTMKIFRLVASAPEL